MGIWPQQALLGWCTGEQDWVAATGSRALEDSWTSGNGVEPLPGGCCEPRVRRNGTHRVVAALIEAGVPVRNIECDTTISMFTTNIACRSAGRFHGPMVV